MPLPINPISQAAKTLSQNLSTASSAFNSVAGSLKLPAGTNLAALNSKVAALGGGIGSTLNGITGSVGGAVSGALGGSLLGNVIGGSASSAISGALGKAAGTLGSGISSAVGALAGAGIGGSPLGNVLSGAASLAGAAGAAGKALGGIGNAIASLSSSTASLGAVFGQLSAAAGQLNNLLSLVRGKSLPSGGELFKTVGAVSAVTVVNPNDWRVRLSCPIETIFPNNEVLKPLIGTSGLIWPYLPNIKISTKANYSTQNPVHNNFPYQMYTNSAVEDITIDGEFSVQNEADGLYWIAATTFLRTATKMFYGSGEFAGNPPVICKLSGYGTFVLNSVPVVIKNFSVDLKDDVNYIQVNVGGRPTWVPAMSTISVTVSPMYNRQQLRKFSLQNFAKGQEIGMI
jgi:hypothetical protein